ncbi:DNA mismatch repair protein MutS [Sediminibacterium sp.]|uniref:MutS-related protein n=1 Tax=Sediminibacterium sp. TaxID=1917865 RepID=UPI0027335CE4|nr:DNA mismatch repair protein MutS [Sediminibacterium sp.]MDP3392327.1 DNA mismatch repair protein MutS [Sediminibacterium sp.]MDP3566871.1 DNA mismatch repair protein MutS [Sediminibacterium sp.]
MQVDKVTLHDLSVFHSEEYQSVFHHVNLTLTNGGREYLRYLLAHPLDSVKAIEQTQLTIQQLGNIVDQYPISPSNGTVLVMEKFYESPINNYPSDIGVVNAYIYKLFNIADYSLSKFTVEHALDFVQGMDKISQLIRFENGSVWLNQTAERIQQLLNKETVQEMIQANKKSLFPVTILKFAQFLRTRYKNATEELIEIHSKLDAYLSLAKAAQKFHFTYPTVVETNEPCIEAEGLYHFLLELPVAYEVQLNQSANFIFLTGANMAGKSTFIKAAGLAAYMAHIGMGVPAKKMKISRLDGILSNIQVTDNIMKGESFFFNEVQRIKKTIERISDGKKWLILIDELFKGTNQEDAIKCSTVVIEGLRKLPNALFILSTHLYEIGNKLQHHPNIQFRYFETEVNNEQLVFSYQLKKGISNDRLGYLILKREGVVSMLENL